MKKEDRAQPRAQRTRPGANLGKEPRFERRRRRLAFSAVKRVSGNAPRKQRGAFRRRSEGLYGKQPPAPPSVPVRARAQAEGGGGRFFKEKNGSPNPKPHAAADAAGESPRKSTRAKSAERSDAMSKNETTTAKTKKTRAKKTPAAAGPAQPPAQPAPQQTAAHTVTHAAQAAATAAVLGLAVMFTHPPAWKLQSKTGVPYWQVEIKDTQGNRYSDVYRMRDQERALALAQRISADRHLPLKINGTPAPAETDVGDTDDLTPEEAAEEDRGETCPF